MFNNLKDKEEFLLQSAIEIGVVRHLLVLKGRKATLENLRSMVSEGELTLEELFLTTLDRKEFLEMDLDGVMYDELAFENFFPGKKDVGAGAWIRVKTPIGYNVYFAKRTNRRVDYTKELTKLQFNLRKINGVLSDNESTSNDLREIGKVIEKDQRRLTELKALEEIGLPQYYVSVKTSKTGTRYLRPFEYEVVSDIELYMNVVISEPGVKSVAVRNIFSAEDKDKIFYLRSRGISEAKAKVLANLGRCYFEVDVMQMMVEVIQPA